MKHWASSGACTVMAKFSRVLDSMKSKFGVLFSREGISGVNQSAFAAREQLKVFQDRGVVIVVVDSGDLVAVASGANLIQILRDKYARRTSGPVDEHRYMPLSPAALPLLETGTDTDCVAVEK